MSDLTETAVNKALTSKWVGRNYHYLESTGSTNDILKGQVTAGNSDDPPAGTVVLTDFQSQGRGRLDRQWQAPPGSSLLLSILFRPDWPGERLSWLTMLAGNAIVEAIENSTTLSPSLKWPNDVVIKHNKIWHKVCGVLLEGHVSMEQRLTYAVMGIGINVHSSPDLPPHAAQPSTSLTVVNEKRVSRLDLLIALLQQIEEQYERADRGYSPRDDWAKRLMTIGQRVEVSRIGQDISLSGVAEGTDEQGQLLVRDDSGQLHTIMAGDVTLRRKSAYVK